MQLQSAQDFDLRKRPAGEKFELSLEHRYRTDQNQPLMLASSRLQLKIAAWGVWIHCQRGLKRVMDIAIVFAVLPILFPLLMLTAIAIKLESPGPIIFRQVRVGKWGRLFTCYKFRSMRTDAEKVKLTLLDQNEVDGPVFKMQHDPRITRIGRIIRKTSIDELPQLYNVLKGDMSIVGPRPAVPNEVLEYEFEQRRRLNAIPGLTGLQQVSGRSDITFDRWIELDMEYIAAQSIWRDLSIIIKTIPTVIRGNGAY